MLTVADLTARWNAYVAQRNQGSEVAPEEMRAFAKNEFAREVEAERQRDELLDRLWRIASGEAKLLSCPWCLADGPLYDRWNHFHRGHIAFVHCGCCGADGPRHYSDAGAEDAVKRARRAWNARVVPT